jgi:hypothetical protein
MNGFIIHIGTHKTGSTSIQQFLLSNREYLEANGLAFLSAPDGKPNFKMLFHASCAPSRRGLMRLKQPGIVRRAFLARRVRRYLASAARASNSLTLIVSSELLSLLREPGEMDTLRALFPPGTPLTVMVCLRDKDGYLASMKRQLAAQKIETSLKQGYSNYVEADSWLVDYDALLAAFRWLTSDVRIVDYTAAVASGENVILPFLRAAGVKQPPATKSLPFLNRRAS